MQVDKPALKQIKMSFLSPNGNHMETIHKEHHKKRRVPHWKRKIQVILNHWITIILMNLVTIYSLFFDDIRIIALEKEDDGYVYGVACFVFFLFLTEIILQSIVEEGYFASFFFWLDLLSTISLLPDIGWIMETFQDTTTSKAASLAKTSRAARVTRIIRIVRVLRLIRIVKLYKQAKVISCPLFTCLDSRVSQEGQRRERTRSQDSSTGERSEGPRK